MNIRETAVHVTAKKIAYRQTRDGNVVSFAMDPKDVPDKLATDPIGTSYMLALVEVDDATGQPKGGQQAQVSDPTEAPRPQTPEGGARCSKCNIETKPQVCEVPGCPIDGRPKRSWDELIPAQQAGILCADPAFHLFLSEAYCEGKWADCAPDDEVARGVVCRQCEIQSRKEIIPGSVAAAIWIGIVARYRAWQHEPEFVG